MRIQYITLLFTFLMCLPLSAQKKGKYTKEEFRAKKQAYMTEKAGLTEEEAENFFPLYFELQDKKAANNRKAWSKSKDGLKPDVTEQEYEDIFNAFFEVNNENSLLDKEYMKKCQKFLSNKKIFMALKAEILFNRHMLKIMQKQKNNKE